MATVQDSPSRLPAHWETLRLAALLGPALIPANSTTRPLLLLKQKSDNNFLCRSTFSLLLHGSCNSCNSSPHGQGGVVNHVLAEANRGIACRLERGRDGWFSRRFVPVSPARVEVRARWSDACPRFHVRIHTHMLAVLQPTLLTGPPASCIMSCHVLSRLPTLSTEQEWHRSPPLDASICPGVG